MKKVLALILASTMCVSLLTACGGSDSASNGGNAVSTTDTSTLTHSQTSRFHS